MPYLMVVFWVDTWENLYRLRALEVQFTPPYAQVIDYDYQHRAEREALRRWLR